MKRLMNKKGFTMIELIVVIIILGIIGGLATPKVLETVKGSKINTAASNLQIVNRLIAQSYAENNALPADAAALEAKLSKSLASLGITAYTPTQATATTTATYSVTFSLSSLGLKNADNIALRDKLITVVSGTSLANNIATAGSVTISGIEIQ